VKGIYNVQIEGQVLQGGMITMTPMGWDHSKTFSSRSIGPENESFLK
jgi:hypothetical protein